MTDDHVMPITPNEGDEVEVTYKSSRSAGPEGPTYNTKTRGGTLERLAAYHEESGTGYHLLVREDATTYLIASVNPAGSGRYAYSVNYDEDTVDSLEISEFYAEGAGWHLSWAYADKTQRVELGRITEVRVVSVGPST